MFRFILCSLIVVICVSQISESFKIESLETGTDYYESQELHARHLIKRETECTPGERFQRDCNTCICGDDGTVATCTLRGCPSTGEGGNTLLVKIPEGSS